MHPHIANSDTHKDNDTLLIFALALPLPRAMHDPLLGLRKSSFGASQPFKQPELTLSKPR